jgi:sugar lactone lactonase YvrE
LKTFLLLLIGIIAILLSSTFFIPSSSATTAPQYATQWGSYGLGKLGQFAFPQGISMDSSGNVYVTDLGNRRVEKFDFNGNFLDTWGTKGNGNGQFQAPAGITVHGNSVYVVDNEQNTIQKFDTTGKFITQWGSKGSDNGQFLLPQGIATDPSGDVYVADTGNSRIAKFSPDGKFITSIGQSGLSNGQFLSPRGVAADSQGSIYVADSGNNRIEKFTQDGVFLKTFSASSGSNFKTPLGLNVDSSGNIYVTDTGNNQIVEINKDGNLLTSWGSQGTGPNFFDNPRDVTIDSAGNVYVVDSSNNRIQKFGSLSSPMSQTPIPANQTQNTLPKINPNDKTPPTITAPVDMTIQATGMLTSVSISQATATDDTLVTSIINDAPSKFPLGTTMVTWTATDSGGNIAKAIQKITVIDTTAPTLTAPPNVTVEAKSPDHNSVDLGLPSAYDAVGVLSVTNDSPAYFPLGQTTITWTAKDASGNAATAKQIIMIQDTTPPTIHAPSDITVEATSATNNVVNLGNATVTDNGIIQSVTNNAPKVFPIGTTKVTWTAIDASGNSATATQTIKIVDTTPPKLTPPPNVVFEATSMTNNHVSLGNATVTDNGIIQSVTNNAPPAFPLGKTNVLWTAKDVAGNISNATQTVNVVDTTPPKITPPKDLKVEATSLNNNTVSLGNATATDIDPITITNNASKTFSIGKTIILWTAKDASSNTSNATQIVNVVHTIPPKISAPPNVVVEATSLNDNIVQLGTPAVNDLQKVNITNNAPKSFPLGMSTVTWTAVDVSGNTANTTQTVTVKDTTPPKITAPADVRVLATSLNGNTAQIGNATATDNVKVVSITNNASKTFSIGKTVILWIATDEAGNKANSTQIVNVVNTIPPKLTPPPNITFEATSLNNNIVSLGNATATDIEPVTITNNASKTFSLGKTAVLWIVKDTSGNTSNATQIVNVVDTTSPKITAPHNIVVNATNPTSNHVNIGNTTATDNVKVISITNNAPAVFPFGNTTVVWTAKDEAGNTANATQIIGVIDRTPPQLTIPQNIMVNATAFNTSITLGQATATGIIDQSPKITSNSTGSFPLGKTIVHWIAADKFGNVKTLDQTVTVLACGKQSSTYNLVMGTSNSDVLTGSMVSNLIIGLGGNDIIHAGPASDCIIAGDGDNIIYGGNGTTTIYSGNGNNIIKGQNGNMVIYVGGGSNIIQGGSGQNTCYLGNPVKDTVVNCQSKIR